MSSICDICSIKVPGEMNQNLVQKSDIESRYVEYRSANVYRMLESSAVCNNFATCKSQLQTNSAVLSGSDSVATLENESDNTTQTSEDILPSHSACSLNRCSLHGDNVCSTCNFNIMKHQNCDSTCERGEIKVFDLSQLSSMIKHYSIKSLRLSLIRISNSQWIRRNIAFLFFICLLCMVQCTTSTKECAVGLTTPGRTWPQGDIVLEYGQPLEILCILHEEYINTHFPGKNASDLVFFRNKRQVHLEYTTLINETTIHMYIKKPPPAEDMYYCKLRLQNDTDTQYEAVCLNKVVIGFKPQQPDNFTCISENWENIVCSWKPLHNYVTTVTGLMFKLPGGGASRRKLYPCPDHSLYITKCVWNTSTNPIYRQPYQNYTFIMNMSNVLGKAVWSYYIDNFASVIPTRPANLTLVDKTSSSISFQWNVPFPMQSFPPGLHHRITYQDGETHTWQVIDITSEPHLSRRFFNITTLEFPNTAYDVRVSIKSATTKDEDHWSNFSAVTARTLATIPALSPRSDIGSFEVIENKDDRRDVYLYWQTIPAAKENGDNFRYQIIYIEQDHKTISLTPNETTATYIKFKGLNASTSYQFEIVAVNQVGINENRAKIFVPSKNNTPHEPILLTKIAFDGGLYELSWKSLNENITNYTIFWCENERDRPYQCAGYLDWTHVSKHTTIYNLTVPHPDKIYQFAISANTEAGSSGMVWASCTVIHNKVIGRMKSVWINNIGSYFIEVGWKLDCSDRIGIVEGFKIYYCPIKGPLDLNCKPNTKFNTTIKADSHTIHGVINNLQPYTTYMLAVAALTKGGETLHSEPLYNTTLEAAPSIPPQDIEITNVTNTTMVIKWKGLEKEEKNGVLRYYEVYYNEHTKRVDDKNDTTLDNLLSGKNYSINVVACTVACSDKSPTIYEVTQIGVPGKINLPLVRFTNSSQVIVKWSMPQYTAGPLNYYEILAGNGEIQNTTGIEARMLIPDCKIVGQEQQYQFRVRAVNIDSNNVHLKGPWSEPGEGNCYSDGPSFGVWIIIWVIGSFSGIAFLLCLMYTSKRMWLKCQAMQDVEVKLPPGLAPNMKLLQKVGEQHIRQSSADSSGCSSGQESVTSSLTSDSQVSTDSGTEVDAVRIAPDKLLETAPTWESSNLRQRNISTARPSCTSETTHWDPYVKVAKSEEPDTVSLIGSTPNLTDSTGCMASQHTWSSAGYISMPSSEELSSNPSPVPKENPNISGYSVIGSIPKPIQTKRNILANRNDSNILGTSGDALVSPKSKNKFIKPYMTLASLEQKSKKQQKPPDFFHNIEELTFPEIKTSKLDTLASITASDKISKPYVQTGLIDTLPKSFISSPADPVKSNIVTSLASTSSTDSCSKKPLVSSFASSLSDSFVKPYVPVSSIVEVSSGDAMEKKELLQKSCIPPIPTSDASSKSYVLASSVFQKSQQQQQTEEMEEIDSSALDAECDEITETVYPLCWQPTSGKESINLNGDKILTKHKSGYVTINEKPSLQTTTSQSDEQYSKVTVVPSTI